MHSKKPFLSTLFVLFVAFGLVACTHQEKQVKSDTIRICDENGCADRPKDYASFQPEPAMSAEDSAKIKALEELAANDPRAAYDLALRFFRADGVRQDTYKSIKWMREAAEKGNFDAQKALGRVYLTGLGEMGSDPGEAEKWLSITANKGDKEASSLLKEAVKARQSEQADYQWRRRWQQIFYNNWYSGYRYNWYWGTGRWYLYY